MNTLCRCLGIVLLGLVGGSALLADDHAPVVTEISKTAEEAPPFVVVLKAQPDGMSSVMLGDGRAMGKGADGRKNLQKTLQAFLSKTGKFPREDVEIAVRIEDGVADEEVPKILETVSGFTDERGKKVRFVNRISLTWMEHKAAVKEK